METKNTNELLSFEKKIEKAKKILEKLSSSDITLNSAAKNYKEGLKELKEAMELLQKAEIEFKELKL